ncbi:nucleotidyltransferase family protein [uncultured Flavobacterium sp.]|uniref:nucleotidyltransferase family protein n=1 Tax=uncultured Flavobacterium sp. TaxID=165435 RepID=UPI0029305C23|nr:nucleotidyltransferase family protein [uncultured Flavobacterium sp.]
MKDRKKQLISYLNNCPEIIETLSKCNDYGLTDYYLAGGAITQLIWNNILGRPNLEKVKDFDIVYYSDTEDRLLEKLHQTNIKKIVTHNFQLDITNQAYVYEWYPKKFGSVIDKFKRTEDGIETWLPAFAIGVRLSSDKFEIFEPYGLDDAFDMIVRPNKLTMTKDNYAKMTESFKSRWHNIHVLPWE